MRIHLIPNSHIDPVWPRADPVEWVRNRPPPDAHPPTGVRIPPNGAPEEGRMANTIVANVDA